MALGWRSLLAGWDQSEALQVAYEEIIGDDRQRQGDYEQELINVEAAQLIYDMRRRQLSAKENLPSVLGRRLP